MDLVKTAASLLRWQGESQSLLCDLYSLLLSCAFVTRLYMLIDPVLAFIKAFRLRGSSENLKMAALSKFDSIVMSKAKEALWDSECSSLLTKAGLCFQQRRGSWKRTQAAADLEDILVAFDKLDETNELPEIYCEATDLVRLPPIIADSCTELVQHNRSILEAIEGKLGSLSTEVSSIASSIESHLATLSSSPLPSQSGATTVDKGGSPPSVSTSNSNPRALNTSPPNRHENLIVFGIKETKSLPDTMVSVKNMLEFLTGRPTPVKDMFRIGRFKKPESGEPAPSRPRPIVLKLASPWDRRLVLASRFNLKHFGVKGIFVREDLSPEARQQRKKDSASRRSTSGSQLSLSKPADVGHSTVLDDSSLR